MIVLIDKLIYVGLFKCLAGVKYSGAIMVFHKGKTIEYYGHRWMISQLNRRFFFGVIQLSEGKRKESEECKTGATERRRNFFRAFPHTACLALHAFVLRAPKKANKIAPVLRASEWYPFFTYSEESLCIKVDPECGVLNVDKKAGTFTSDYFRWKGFRSETTIGKYVCVRGAIHVCMRNCRKRRKMSVFTNTRIRVDETWHQFPN